MGLNLLNCMLSRFLSVIYEARPSKSYLAQQEICMNLTLQGRYLLDLAAPLLKMHYRQDYFEKTQLV